MQKGVFLSALVRGLYEVFVKVSASSHPKAPEFSRSPYTGSRVSENLALGSSVSVERHPRGHNSMGPPGGSHMPSLRWKCRSTFPSHTTKTATVKCRPVCLPLRGSGYTRPSVGYGLQGMVSLRVGSFGDTSAKEWSSDVAVTLWGLQAIRRDAGRGVLQRVPADHPRQRYG
jgi:hypothetical protein